MAFRLIRLAMDRDPRVATSLRVLVVMGIACYDGGHVAYQIVATPCSGDVRTNVRIVSNHASSDLVRWLKGFTFVAVEHRDGVSPGTARWAVWSMTVVMLVV